MIYLIIVVFIFILLFFNNNTQEGYCNREENKVSGYNRKFGENIDVSNVGLGYDCYTKCIDSNNCYYVGLGFDCYNSCFNNIPNVREAI